LVLIDFTQGITMKFTGDLYYEDNDLLKVHSLIVRSDSEIAFELVSNWSGQGKWKRSGIAKFDGSAYVSNNEHSVCVETNDQGNECTIIFSNIIVDGDFMSLEGFWQESGESYKFDGDLEKC
jgi:hypothetical protein